MDIKDIFSLTDADMSTIIDALEHYKSKGFASELVGMMFEGILEKPEDQCTEEELARKLVRKQEKEEEKKKREQENEILKREIDLLKSKVIIIQSSNRRSGYKQIEE